MMEKEMAKLENPPMPRNSSWAYPKRPRSARSCSGKDIARRRLEFHVLLQVLADGLLHQLLQGLARLGVDESVLHDVPIELVAARPKRHLDLPGAGFRHDREFARRPLEGYGNRAAVKAGLEAIIVTGQDQVALQAGQCFVSVLFELVFFDHAILPCGSPEIVPLRTTTVALQYAACMRKVARGCGCGRL